MCGKGKNFYFAKSGLTQNWGGSPKDLCGKSKMFFLLQIKSEEKLFTLKKQRFHNGLSEKDANMTCLLKDTKK
jgi:hypothetical protein